ncbi:MAG: FAD-binding oxidoreductase [Rhodospirillaceae bacterium]|nr:FAD-binding oxidoreductase [Rhodospirillaceae bacterium]
MAPKDVTTHPLILRLAQAVGPDHVLTSAEDRVFYSHDVYRQLETPLAVVRPGSVEELARVVGMATAEGVAIVPRGGGASYSDGYCATTDNSISIDTSRLNKISVNERDMTVTVESGVTWAELYDTLSKKGLRTPFWGPFSGLKATVGGSMSQGSVSLGSSLYGPSADSVLSMDVVLADGSILKTGSAAAANGTPFFRHYGPDLSALFTGDTGAMGVKARITLRLIKHPPVKMSVSFGFQTFEGMAAGMEAAAKEGVVSDSFGLNPRLQRAWLGRTNMKQSMDAAFNVYKTARNPIDGLFKLIRMAVAGKSFLDKSEYSAHFICEGVDAAHARSLLAAVRRAVEPHGIEVPNTIPTVVASMPFMPLYPIMGPAGERWVPLHGILPFSAVKPFHDKLTAFHQQYAAQMEKHNIVTAAMFTTISTTGFLYEPVFYWQDTRHLYHERYLPQDFLGLLPTYGENPEGRKLVEEMRAGIRAIFASCGAVHLQVGKSYPYMKDREPRNAEMVKAVKALVDPKRLMNPGSLGL